MIVLALAMSIHATPVHINYYAEAARIPKDQRVYAKCISNQESHGNYRAIGDNTNARGRWQFLDSNWRRGLSFMVTKRLVSFGMPESKQKSLVKHLQSRSIDTWKPAYQDIGFISALNAKHKWSGWRHWAVDVKCTKYVPKQFR